VQQQQQQVQGISASRTLAWVHFQRSTYKAHYDHLAKTRRHVATPRD
jgi:hypothetical protein